MVVFILNRAPTKSVEGKTPYEAWHGERPPVHFFRTFAHVKVVKPNVKKLDDRSVPMVFIGYEDGSKSYRVYDPDGNRVHIIRDVVFEESARWNWGKDGGIPVADSGESFAVEYITYKVPCGPHATPTTEDGSALLDTVPVDTPRTPGTAAAATPVSLVSPTSAAMATLDGYDDGDAPRRFRTLDNICDAGAAPIPEAEELQCTAADEPATFAEVEQSKSWRQAMLDELKSIEDNATWELVDLPAGHRPIGLKWVYKVKKDERDEIIKHKARFVAKGYVQRFGNDYDEVFAPVAHLESVRLLLALARHEGWAVHHMDVQTAFLNAILARKSTSRNQPGSR